MTQAPRIKCVVCDEGIVGLEWKNEETSAFITAWGEDRVQTAINECKRNKPVHMKIAAENGLSEKDCNACLEA